jgi:benzoyl-CoA reductase/2-hydroxyglutaryl-CoA dehydratase subunit BcrC/BadD/HgdB
MDKRTIRYEEKDKVQFLNSRSIVFGDGSEVTPEEIWRFLTVEAPEEYPFAFESNMFYGSTASDDVTLPASLKITYLNLTTSRRLDKFKQNGGSVALVQGGQAIDPYTAAGVVALRPLLVNTWTRGRKRGNNSVQEELGRKDEKEKGYRNISFEACNTAGYEHIQEGGLEIDIVAPYSALRCSDICYSVEAHRHGGRGDVSIFLGDYPVRYQSKKPWAIEYFAANLKRLIKELDRITGRTTTEDDLRAAIKLHNKGRRLALELAELWYKAPQPPTNGLDRSALFIMGLLEMHADPIATLSVLSEAVESVRSRVENGVKSPKVADDAKRLFVCGSCVHLDDYRCEDEGAVVVGTDNSWSHCVTLVDEDGDPYWNLAKATLEYPYEQSIKERVAWTVEQIKKSRADGMLFLYNWGCNTQAAISRAIADEVRKQAGIPTIVMENELVGLKPEQQQNRVSAFIEMV